MARVPYTNQEDLDAEYRDLIVSSLQPGKRINAYSLVGNNPEILEGFRGFLGAVWNHSGLTDRQREIVVMSVIAEFGNAYEWHQHVTIGRDAGLSDEEMAAIARDDQGTFPPRERALIGYARAAARGRVEDPLHEALAEHFDDETVVGAAMAVSAYVALSRSIDALDPEIEDEEFVGWDPR